MATWEACSSNLESWEPSQHLLIDTEKPRETCAEVASRRTSRILTSSKQSGKSSQQSGNQASNPSVACGLYPPSYLIPFDSPTLRVSEMKVRSPSPIVVQISWASLRACTCGGQITQMYASLANTVFPPDVRKSDRHVWNCVGLELGLRRRSAPFIFDLVCS
jgi:hypothetical protein